MSQLCCDCSHFDQVRGRCTLRGQYVSAYETCDDFDTGARRATMFGPCSTCRYLSYGNYDEPICSKCGYNAHDAALSCPLCQDDDTDDSDDSGYGEYGGTKVEPEPFVGWGIGVVLHILIILATFACCFFIGRFHTNDEMLPKIFIAAAVIPCIGGFIHGISKPWQPSLSMLMATAVAANLFLVTWEVDVRHPEYIIMAVLFAVIGFFVALGLNVLFTKITNFIFRVESSSY